MTEKPILFSTDMVQAILDDRKTQTRRTRSLNEINKEPDKWVCHGIDNPFGLFVFDDTEGFEPRIKCPYGQAGDRLWVRETWSLALAKHGECFKYRAPINHKLYYQCGKECPEGVETITKWNPSIHMPRRASRITLKVTEVRVERLQDITAEEVIKEGCQLTGEIFLSPQEERPVLVNKFERLWDSLYAKRGYGWEVNPFVWCISFKRIDK